MAITTKKVSWILDADLNGFFDAIDHNWMIKFLKLRIADKRVLRLIQSWLSAGVVDGENKYKSFVGTPQGGVISPLLANIYLHYALDLWLQQWRKRDARGDVYIIRYADDFVIGLQYQSDGKKIMEALRQRLAKFQLRLNESKTHLIEFGRFAISNRLQRGQRKPETFDFLGFTHICSQGRRDDGYKLLNYFAYQSRRS
jgi:RNA-directed DNA polymerase